MDLDEARRTIWAARPMFAETHETTRDVEAVSIALETAEDLVVEVEQCRDLAVRLEQRVAELEARLQAVRKYAASRLTRTDTERVAYLMARVLDVMDSDPAIDREGNWHSPEEWAEVQKFLVDHEKFDCNCLACADFRKAVAALGPARG